MLTIRDLTLAYNGHNVLEDISLELPAGQVLGLIGPNGAGKTSLIRAISGVLPVKQGRIEVGGQNLGDLSELQRARRIAVVPQSASLPPAFSVAECVALGRTPHLNWLGQLGAADEAQVQRALAATETEAIAERRVGQLSGGEQQRVLLARALAQDCPILLLDEPTAHLDLHHQAAILELVRRMAAEQDLAVLVAIHDLNLAAMYADRLALLVGGRLRVAGPPAEVLTEEHLAAAYATPLRIRQENGEYWVQLRRDPPQK
jgi:iron complex transport system ATP-binding protein